MEQHGRESTTPDGSCGIEGNTSQRRGYRQQSIAHPRSELTPSSPGKRSTPGRGRRILGASILLLPLLSACGFGQHEEKPLEQPTPRFGYAQPYSSQETSSPQNIPLATQSGEHANTLPPATAPVHPKPATPRATGTSTTAPAPKAAPSHRPSPTHAPRATTAHPRATTPTHRAPTHRSTPRPTATHTHVAAPAPVATDTTQGGAGSVYYANCSEVKAAGAAPLSEGSPGYSSKLDRDHDGVACES